MAEAAAKTKAPSNIQDVSDKDFQTFIDVLNTLSLGPIYAQPSGEKTREITFGGGASGVPETTATAGKSGSLSETYQTHLLNYLMQKAMPGLAREGAQPVERPDVATPGTSLSDFIDILNTLKLNNQQTITGQPRLEGTVTAPGGTERLSTSGYGATPEARMEDVAKSLTDTIAFVAKYPHLFRKQGSGE